MTKTNQPSTSTPMFDRSAYIHISFREHTCYHCDLNKVFLEGQPVDEYTQSLLKGIQLTRVLYPEQETKTIYTGGDMPTSPPAKQLDVLLKGVREQLTFDDRNEFTVEANPGDLAQEEL